MNRPILPVLLLLLAWPCVCLAEPAVMSKADSLYEKPFADARVLGKLTAGQGVDIQKRQGAWYQVKAAGKLGWARLLSVRRSAPAPARSSLPPGCAGSARRRSRRRPSARRPWPPSRSTG